MTRTPNNHPIIVSAGHWTDPIGRTGCTVVLFDRPAPAVVDVRGGAPGTRETDLLGQGDLVQSVDAVLLSGGSAFGLAAADGVMSFLRAAGRGVATSAGPVPIVPAAVLFDLANGHPVWPDAQAGRAACESARPIQAIERGMVGAGTGATTAKLVAGVAPNRGGIGLGSTVVDGLGSVTALVAVNCVGHVRLSDESHDIDLRESLLQEVIPPLSRTSTTLGVVILDGPVDRRCLERAAIAAHDGYARRIVPCHTIYDGDVVFAAGTASGDVAPVDVLRWCVGAELAVERAIIDAIIS